MIVQVSSSSADYSESLQALKFASRVSGVKNAIAHTRTTNQTQSKQNAEFTRVRAENKELQAHSMQLQEELDGAYKIVVNKDEEIAQLRREVEIMGQQNADAKEELKRVKSIVDLLQKKYKQRIAIQNDQVRQSIGHASLASPGLDSRKLIKYILSSFSSIMIC